MLPTDSAGADERLQDVLREGISAEDLPALYTSAHVYCAPNTGGESQGIVLLEALAAGRAVVASGIPGFRTVITHQENGLLVPPASQEELAWAVCHLLGETAERARLGAAGRLRALDFSWEQVGGRVETYYDELFTHYAHTRRRRTLFPSGAPLSLVE